VRNGNTDANARADSYICANQICATGGFSNTNSILDADCDKHSNGHINTQADNRAY
jgi:hypothetical protein